MHLELYQQETQKLADKNGALLNQLHQKLAQTSELSMIEEQAMLHLFQVLIENAIGKARHLLKAKKESVPISAYDLFEKLHEIGLMDGAELRKWKKIVGLRNTIVHESMKVNIDLVKRVVIAKEFNLIVDFLNRPFNQFITQQT